MTVPTTQQQLDLARQALADRLAGRSVTNVSSGGRSVAYATLTLQELQDVVARLENAVAGRATRRALWPWF